MTQYMFALEGTSPKPPTKQSELSPGAQKLVEILSKTAAPEVLVKLRQVTELIGEEKTNELVLFVRNHRRLVRPKISAQSKIPKHKRFTASELGGFITADLFAAINEAQKTKVDRKPKNQGEPNPEILKKAQEQYDAS